MKSNYILSVSIFSAQVKRECKQLVDTYTSQIVTMLVSEYTPEQVCAGLGLCDKGFDDSDYDNEILSNDIPELIDENDISQESLEVFDDRALVNGNRMVLIISFYIKYFKFLNIVI